MAVEQILGSIQPKPAGAAATGGRAAAPGFGESVARVIQAVEQTGADANAAVSRMLDGSGDVHDAMIGLQRADLTFQLTVQVKNKLIQAYQEIMRMPV